MTFVAGRMASLWTLIVVTAVLVYSSVAFRKRLPSIRPPAGFLAVEEAVGRATEMGRPVHFSPGTGSITTKDAPQVFAAFEILGHVTKLAGRMGTKVITTIRYPELVPLAQEVVSEAYASESRPDLYSDDLVRFLSSAQLAYAAGAMGIVEREKCAASFLCGPFLAESLVLAEVGARVGAIQVGATATMSQIPFFVAACDYTLIGDELYVAAALSTGDRVQMASIWGQDVVKAGLLGVLLIGLVAKYAGILDMAKLLKL